MIGVIHAYSRANAGDGLLVDLTLERLARAGVSPEDISLVALDPGSFSDLPHRIGVGTPSRRLDGDVLRAAGQAVPAMTGAALGRPWGHVATTLDECDALIAVGGGYLRTPDLTASAGVLLNHLPQLALAARSQRPTVYLPQSIGPLRGPVGATVRRLLRKIDHVFVRDPWSAAELSKVPGLTRMPDLAVLHLAEAPSGPVRAAEQGVALVGRSVDHVTDDLLVLRALARELGADARWAVQATGDSTKSDAAYYAREGIPAAGTLPQLLSGDELGVTVSVRLHGALMSILAGVPAIHLAYDRKGPAAFADLGLESWCFDLRTATVDAVAHAVRSLREDPSQYWSAVEPARPALASASQQLDRVIAAAVSGELTA